jgi:translation initiation factor IF-3
VKRDKKNKSNAPILNERIKGDTFRLVGVEDTKKPNDKKGIFSRREIFDLAESLDLDVLLVNFKTDPACVKILNWNKQEYKKKKLENENRKNNKTVTKEIRISPNIQPHDIRHKTSQAEKFLNQGAKVKITMRIKGRHNNPNLKAAAEVKMLQFVKDLGDFGSPEALPKFISGRFQVVIKPNKKKIKN